ncbi:hypothetical protein F5878DRAFT_325480 [Lentinula raphanica]|uniref:BTB domain-containing protein n=1 Tax=Lentinula raphanica TaxID=153919 RepID=A0AA38P2M6_9AGAR|nr:hypothetical protein F5880DRAFT_225983 [Lentinula raphanica]KAJ3835149.1 hypothetical protein F5878DRAFT_325480 [Lentinula raphanica]
MSTQSQRFNANDADVVIRSSDNVDFRLHKKNLEFATGGFPPTTTSSDSGEVVKLDETAATLDIMFQFVYPKRYPPLYKMEFEDLMLLAEAAEKYQVFALMNTCEFHLRKFLEEPYAMRILEFAAAHDYRGLIEELAMVLIDQPLSAIADKIPDYTIYKLWSAYREERMRLLFHANQAPQKPLFSDNMNFSHCNCHNGTWHRIVPVIQQQLQKPSDLNSSHIQAVFKRVQESEPPKPSQCCTRELDRWRSIIMNDIIQIQPFSLSK